MAEVGNDRSLVETAPLAERSSFYRFAVRLRLATPALVVFAVGVWVISPRFSITGPSLIDDWYAIRAAPRVLHEVLTLSPDVRARFNPGWVLWNWIQWRLPGAPENMLGPNALGVARLALLVTGMTTATAILVRRDDEYPFARALLYSLPALVVVTVPDFAVELARFGPQEPALTGGMLLGGSMMYWGGRELNDGAATRVRPWLLLGVGLSIWCYGVFQKETSICAFLLLVLIVPCGRNWWRKLRSGEHRTLVAAAILAAAALPLLIVLYEVAKIVERGSLVYGARVRTGGSAVSVFLHGFGHMHSETHSRLGFLLTAIVLAALLLGLLRRHVDWTLLALILVAFASFEMSFQSGVYTGRYYLPTIALLAIGSARAIRVLPKIPRYAVAGVAFALLLISANGANTNTRDWASGDQLGDDLVSAVALSTNNGCNLRIKGVDDERSQAIAFLVSYHHPFDCKQVARHSLIGPSATQTPATACGILKPTLIGEWRVGNAEPIQLFRCDQLDATNVVPRRMLGRSTHMERVGRWLVRQDPAAVEARARGVATCQFSRTITELDRERRMAATAQALLELPECAAHTAAELARRDRPVDRINSDAQLARHGGSRGRASPRHPTEEDIEFGMAPGDAAF